MHENEVSTSARKSRKRGCSVTLVLVVIVLIVAWFLLRPGVFTIQPIGA
jgi:t-SNARE complex subunit (syntaxin)